MNRILLFVLVVSTLIFSLERLSEPQTKPEEPQSGHEDSKSRVVALKSERSSDRALVTIDGPSAKETIASAINAHGDIVGRYTDQKDRVHGFLLDRYGIFHTLDHSTTGTIMTVARGINDHGDIVGQHRTADGNRHAYILRMGRYTTLDYPGAPAGTETFAWNINNAGVVVGQVLFPGAGGVHGFSLKGGVWSLIDYPQSKKTVAGGINSKGEIVGKWTGMDDKEHGFLLRKGRFTSIDVPKSNSTIIDAILDSRTVVGTFSDENGVHRGFVMSNLSENGKFASLRIIDIPGVTVVRGINARGDLVGRYNDDEGKGHGYVIWSGRRRKSARLH